MTNAWRRRSAAVTGFVVCLIMSSAALAEMLLLRTDLKSANTVPPNNSPATGTAEATLDTSTNKLSWKVTYSDLSSPLLGAHFHGPGEPDKNVGIVLPFKTSPSPIEGSATLTSPQARDMMAGKWYVIIHTESHPEGEIRGQMMKN
ncbi:MAG: CHRD domain-containing protein [Beijerinckiaceae bacterium]